MQQKKKEEEQWKRKMAYFVSCGHFLAALYRPLFVLDSQLTFSSNLKKNIKKNQ